MDGPSDTISLHKRFARAVLRARVRRAAVTPVMRGLLAIGLAVAICAGLETQAAGQGALVLEAKVPLGNVRGRIDHLAVDLDRKRLFVAELGNDSVGVVDLAAGKLLHRIAGLKEPQGVGYVPSVDTLYAANAGDGSVRIFAGEDYAPVGRIDLGEDADNVRVDPAANVVFVGYGAGALAAVDPTTRKKIADVALKAHPEGFQLGAGTNQIFVNLPNTRSIAVIDRATGQQSAGWPTGNLAGNFPMSLDEANRRVVVVFRSPARLVVFAMANGEKVAERETCGDSDDVFMDAKRKRIYVSCGDGFIDAFDAEGTSYQRLARIPTERGARTSLFIPAMDRLAVAVRATAAGPAAIWLYRTGP
jgi:DNA-binding beta-propeller fold protein YncE